MTIKCAIYAMLLVAAFQTKVKDRNIKDSNTAPASVIFKPYQEVSSLSISTKDCSTAVTISPKGEAFFADCYKPAEVAEVFWQVMAHKSPEALEQRIKTLEAIIAAKGYYDITQQKGECFIVVPHNEKKK